MLADRLRKHGAQAWLVNTGWSGGAYGVGSRIKLAHTRAIIDAIHSGALADAPTQRDPNFKLDYCTRCPDVPDTLLQPVSRLERSSRLRSDRPKTGRPIPREFREVWRRKRSGESCRAVIE